MMVLKDFLQLKRFLSAISPNIPAFHVDAIQEGYLKRHFISMRYTISETFNYSNQRRYGK